MLGIFVLLTAAGYIAMGLMVPNAFHSIYFLGFLACLIIGYTFFRLPVWHATTVGLIAGFICIDGLRVVTGDYVLFAPTLELMEASRIRMVKMRAVERKVTC